MVSSQTYTVRGMTCAHCIDAVTQEVGAIVGVTDVQVDLDTGGLTLMVSTPVRDVVVAEAVEEAGYALAV